MTAKEDALFFSSKESGYADGYGDTVLAFSIPSTVLEVNDIFDGEVHFDIPLKMRNGKFGIDVSKYVLNVDYNKKTMNGMYQVGSGRIVTFTHDTPFIVNNSISRKSDLSTPIRYMRPQEQSEVDELRRQLET